MAFLFRALGSAVEFVSRTAEITITAMGEIVSQAKRLFSTEPARLPPHVELLGDQKGGRKVAKEGVGNSEGSLSGKLGNLSVRNGEVARIVKEARLQMGVDCVKHYNFAACGHSGVGKSSFINAFLHLMGDMACPVGEVETTQKIQKYFSKETPYLMIWDIPGAGTLNHPANTYFEDKKLYVFDAILILSSDRFLAMDFKILRSARKYRAPCVFVRTKCDISVHSRAQRDGIDTFTASELIRRDVKSSFDKNIETAGLRLDIIPAPELFFISNNFFSLQNPYALFNTKTKVLDSSLYSMDELKLSRFLYETAKVRAPNSKNEPQRGKVMA